MALVSDEVFFDYGLAEDTGRAASPLTAEDCLTFSMSGLSKIAAFRK